MSLARYRRQGQPQQKIGPEHLDRAAVVYLLSELRDIVAVQERAQRRRRTMRMPGIYSWQVHKGVTAA